jgi:triosephosphate isomerase
MNKTIAESLATVSALLERVPRRPDNVEIVLAPSALALAPVMAACRETGIALAAQTVSYMQKRSYCGELSPRMIGELCRYAFVGHSERRLYFGDTDETVNRRVLACLEEGLMPILCVGEERQDYEAGRTQERISRQLLAALNGVDDISEIVFLYEPVWALGTGKTLGGAEANAVIAGMRTILEHRFDASSASEARIVYAGSANPANAKEYLMQPMIDGLALGSASLEASSLAEIILQAADIG